MQNDLDFFHPMGLDRGRFLVHHLDHRVVDGGLNGILNINLVVESVMGENDVSPQMQTPQPQMER